MQVEVFTESPFKPDTTLRFIFNPNKKLNSWAIDSWDDPYEECKTVLVPHTVKDRVDSIFQKVIGSSVKLDFDLDRDYGEMLTKVMEFRCTQNYPECSDFCRHRYRNLIDGKHIKTTRVWSHRVYHEILEKSAEETNRKKKKLIAFIDSQNPDKFLRKYDCQHGGEKIMKEKEALDFILLSFFGNNGHFEDLDIGNAAYRFDASFFNDCNKGNCNFDYKKRVVWSSKSTVKSEPDLTTVNRSRPMPFIRASTYKPQEGRMPRARIYSHICKCSDQKIHYRLVHSVSDNDGAIETRHETGHNMEPLFYSYFKRALPKRKNKEEEKVSAQAKVVAKLMTARFTGKTLKGVLADPKDRHSKGQLSKTIENFSRVVEYWPDIESVRPLLVSGETSSGIDFEAHVDDIVQAIDSNLNSDAVAADLKRYLDEYGLALATAKESIVRANYGDPKELRI